MQRPISRQRSARGAVMLEALIGILIFSVGVLGLVGLQVSMTRAQSSAKFRADASYLASELVGQVWADRTNIASYTTTPASVCTYQRCADWVGKVSRGLPSGVATATAVASTGEVGITLTWSLPEEGSHSYAITTQVR